MFEYSGFLFARPSFVEGVGRLLDFGGTFSEYNTSETPDRADERALAADMAAIGADLMEAVRQHETACQNQNRSASKAKR